MAKLPESWGLTTEKRSDGKLDIIGKDDNGERYKVRTTDSGEVSETDVQELHDADRESYSNRSTAAREYVNKITEWGNKRRESRETAFEESLVDPAANVTFALLDRKGHSSPFTGSTRAYREGWEYWMSTLREDN